MRGMKSKAGDDSTFQFSDFAINVVSDLEEEIVRAHLEKKKIAGAKLKMEEEEAMLQFGAHGAGGPIDSRSRLQLGSG
mgnify:CR=1 FL=1